MISAKDLNRCIDLLAELNTTANTNEKRKILEIGYILKTELETVESWNTQELSLREKGRGNIDVKKLLEDNTQLFNENRQLQDLNVKLTQVINERIPFVENSIGEITNKFEYLTESLKKL